mmetsp:Transcript_53665/g.117131  ORF Transcript_53665/g.117131 Transcript_53665/m.117131 type:complete len:92 (+) Transcript_53665:516-791(+)
MEWLLMETNKKVSSNVSDITKLQNRKGFQSVQTRTMELYSYHNIMEYTELNQYTSALLIISDHSTLNINLQMMVSSTQDLQLYVKLKRNTD